MTTKAQASDIVRVLAGTVNNLRADNSINDEAKKTLDLTAKFLLDEIAAALAEVERLKHELRDTANERNQAEVSVAALTARLAAAEQERDEATSAPGGHGDGALSCGHNRYWNTLYDHCMVCRAVQAEQELAAMEREWEDDVADLVKRCACEWEGEEPRIQTVECGTHMKLKQQLAAMTKERDRLREICEAATEEVIEYANVSGIPSGRPTEPSLPESIRQLKHDLRQQLAASAQRVKALEVELNTPEVLDFAKAVNIEAAHQRARWGTDHDGGKTDTDWFWLVGYLVGKALHLPDKRLHHLITAAAALANWHLYAVEKTNKEVSMEWQVFRRTNTSTMRPYVPGEDLTEISVSKEDTPELGGMIARNPENPDDQWYVAKAYFEKNFAPL